MLAAKDELFTRPSGSYTIGKSVRLRQSASAYLNRTPASSGSQTTFTHSIWLKRGLLSSSNYVTIYGSESSGANYVNCAFYQDNLYWTTYNGSTNITITTTQVFRDVSAWYHLVIAVDTTQATAANRVKLYVNGTQITAGTFNYPSQNQSLQINTSSYVHKLGFSSGFGQYYDGYFAEINFIDGQALTPSSFGSTNSITGVWQPAKYTGTYGTNGFYLNFSSNGTAAALGTDFSGNSNTWTINNISVTAGATYDSMTDVPTLTSATAANYCVLNPLDKGTTITIQDANLTGTIGATHNGVRGTFQFPTSGKWYWEITPSTTTSGSNIISFGLATSTASMNTYDYNTTGTYSLYLSADRQFIVNGSGTSNFGGTTASGTVCGIAYDADNGQLYLAIGNTYYKSDGTGTGNPSGGTNSSMAVSASLGLFPYVHLYGNTGYANFGQRGFTYTPPTGYVALNTYNLPTSTITNGAAYMAATLYTGNLTGQSITNTANGTSFQPDLVWIKSRSAATDNKWTDSVRGATKALVSNSTAAETTDTTGVTSINSNGFTLGISTVYNNTATTYIAWQWQAGASAGSSNTNGSITSTVSVGATQGFSVVTWTGTGSNATVGHGLGVAPNMIIAKDRSTSGELWAVYTSMLGNGYNLYLNTTDAKDPTTLTWNSTSPTSSVFSIGTSTRINASGRNYVAYCFAAVAGYSAFGSYTGNGSTDGPFVYLGFRPRWIMIKNATGTASANTGWYIFDTSRNTYNTLSNPLRADLSDAESSGYAIDYLSNGFKLKISDSGINSSAGATHIYAAFAENPFKNSLAR